MRAYGEDMVKQHVQLLENMRISSEREKKREKRGKEFINDYINIGWRVWRNICNIPSAEIV